MDLDATDEQLDCPFVFASAKAGTAVKNLSDEPKDMSPLFETILDYIPAPEGDEKGELQMLVSSIDYNDYVGRIGIGRIINGSLKSQEQLSLMKADGTIKKGKITKLFGFKDLGRVEIEEAVAELDPELYAIMEEAAENIKDFHKKQLRNSFFDTTQEGLEKEYENMAQAYTRIFKSIKSAILLKNVIKGLSKLSHLFINSFLVI